jgi:tetratricopeptide (TPR) repeat protein
MIARVMIGMLLATANPAPAPQVSAVDAAREIYLSGRYAEAVPLLKAEVQTDPNNAQAYFWLAQCTFELHEFDEAIKYAERAVELDPNKSEYHYVLGKAYGRKAEHANWFSGLSLAKKTHTEFEKAVELDPHNLHAQRDLINYYSRAPGVAGGGEDKAKAQIEKLRAIDPIEGHLGQLDFYAERKDWDKASAEAESVIVSKPKNAEPYLDVLEYFERRQNVAGIREAVRVAAENDVQSASFDYYTGVADILSGEQLNEAETSLRRFTVRVPPRSTGPSQTRAHVWLGRLYEKLGRRDDAITQYRLALKMEQNNKDAREGLKRLGVS